MEFERIKPRPRPETSQREVPREPPAPKPQPSAFDQVIRQQAMAVPYRAPEQQKSTIQRAMEQETARERKENRETKRERRTESRDERPQAERGRRVQHQQHKEGVEHRIVARKDAQDEGRQQKGQGGQQFGGGGAGSGGERAKHSESVRDSNRLKSEVTAETLQTFRQELLAQQQEQVPNHFNTKQMQQLVNQLLHYIRVRRDEVSGDELVLGFQATVFKGLRLRLRAKDGTVSVEILSSDAAIRALFAKERERIAERLQAKGVKVGPIVIRA